jgi:hypothetical protein
VSVQSACDTRAVLHNERTLDVDGCERRRFDDVNRARLVTLLGLAIVALALAATSAPGAPPRQVAGARASSAGTFIRTVLHLRMSRRYAHLYTKLHPAQQVFISRARFIDCENQRDEAYGLTVKLIAFKAIRSVEQRILIPGTHQTAQSIAVKYKYTVRTGGGSTFSITDDSHVIRVNGLWKWLVTSKDAYAYKTGRCRIT